MPGLDFPPKDTGEGRLLAWAVAANIRPIDRAGKEPGKVYKGTPVFGPNAKIYAGEVYWGMYDSAHFIGLNRVTKRFSNAVVNLFAVHNCRLQSIYSESLLASLRKREAKVFDSRADAETFCDHLATAIKFEHDRRDNSPDKAG